MSSALFLVGPPGVGKTTAARRIMTALDPRGPAFLTPKPKWTVREGAYAAAGHYTGGTFDGADTVPYSGVKEALDFWEVCLLGWHPRLTLFDGDRFSHASALERVRRVAGGAWVLHLTASDEELAERRRARGSNQNAAWAKGRATKAERFAGLFAPAERLSLEEVLANLERKTLTT